MFKILQKAIKHRYLLSWLIAFFIGGILYPLTCKAESIPSLSNDTVSLILEGHDSLTYSQFSSFGAVPLNPNPTMYYNMFASAQNDPLITGARLNAMDNNDYTVSSLTESQIDTLSSSIPYLYDVQGNVVNWDDVYYVSYMNGMFHGELYVDSSGNILTEDINKTKTMFKLGLGGYLLGVQDIANIYSDLQQSIVNNAYQYIIDGVPNSNSAYYVFFSPYGGLNANKVYSFYIPNQYINGVIVPTTSNNGQIINEWYCNDTSAFTYIGPSGGEYNVSIQNGTWNKDGYTYHYKIYWPTNYHLDRFPNVNNTYSSFLNGNQWNDPNVFAKIGINYIPSNATNSNIVDFKKILDFPSTKHLQIDDSYDYNFIKEYEEELNDSTPELNESFDPSQSISESNYPYSYEVPETLPTPNSSSINFPSQNTAVDPSLDYGIVTQPTNQSILDSFSNLQIPFLQNIRYRFPFCIPWDLRDAVSLLQFSPTAPAWDFDWEITALGHTYTYHCVGDLSDYDSLALLFRRLMLCAVFIGLAFWTYKLML